MRVLITGVGGSGKTTTVKALEERYGGTSVDLDDTGVCFWQNKITGARAVYTAGENTAWLKEYRWVLDITALKQLLGAHESDPFLFVAGKISKKQVAEVFPCFDVVFLLAPSDEVLQHRQSSRIKEDSFAKSSHEQEYIKSSRSVFEHICLEHGAISINADMILEDVVNQVYNKLNTI